MSDGPDLTANEDLPDWSDEEVARDFSGVINYHGLDTRMGVPDFILGDLLVATLRAFSSAKSRNDSWHTSDDSIRDLLKPS